MNKRFLSERDICTKFITPSLVAAGWDLDTQIREEVGFTDGRIYVRGKVHARGAKKRVDHIHHSGWSRWWSGCTNTAPPSSPPPSRAR